MIRDPRLNLSLSSKNRRFNQSGNAHQYKIPRGTGSCTSARCRESALPFSDERLSHIRRRFIPPGKRKKRAPPPPFQNHLSLSSIASRSIQSRSSEHIAKYTTSSPHTHKASRASLTHWFPHPPGVLVCEFVCRINKSVENVSSDDDKNWPQRLDLSDDW